MRIYEDFIVHDCTADCSVTKSITIEKGVNDEIQLYLMVRPSIIRLVGVIHCLHVKCHSLTYVYGRTGYQEAVGCIHILLFQIVCTRRI